MTFLFGTASQRQSAIDGEVFGFCSDPIADDDDDDDSRLAAAGARANCGWAGGRWKMEKRSAADLFMALAVDVIDLLIMMLIFRYFFDSVIKVR